jgi:hypothetical protein
MVSVRKGMPGPTLGKSAFTERAKARFYDPAFAQVLLINGSLRSEHTCPGEMSKTWRLVEQVQKVLKEQDFEIDLLDLSHLCSEYGRVIYPCKAPWCAIAEAVTLQRKGALPQPDAGVKDPRPK